VDLREFHSELKIAGTFVSFFVGVVGVFKSHGMVVGLVKSRAYCKGSFPFMVL